MYPLSSHGLNSETDLEVRFFTPAFHVFDNFSAHRIELWGKIFPTAEHAYQWKKFSVSHPQVAAAILNAGSPESALRIAHASKQNVDLAWLDIKRSVMEEIIRAKCMQHTDVREQLIKTGNRLIYENSPVDSYWGCGPEGDGENHLGHIWMKVRDEL